VYSRPRARKCHISREAQLATGRQECGLSAQETDAMHRYFFNFRKGDEISMDRRGMWLADPNMARREAIQLWGTLLAVAIVEGDPVEDCEYEIASDSGQTILKLPLSAQGTIQ
jgi:hypothetical protein